MAKIESTHVPVEDVCAWCGKRIWSPENVWREMTSFWGIVLTANYCAPRDKERDPAYDKVSRCKVKGLDNPYTVELNLKRALTKEAAA
jgi:hypothetical protein